MKNHKFVKALLEGCTVDISLEIEINDSSVNILAICPNGETCSAQDFDLTSCLWKLHGAISEVGVQLLCYGLIKNFHPSRMSSQMSLGRQAYILTSGKQTGKDDMVDIFDRPECFILSSASEQKEFFKTWLNSLK